MDESNQDLSSFLSLQQLLEELESLTVLEYQKNRSPWISITRLSELFCDKYGVLPENVAELQGYNNGLKSFLKSSRRFSIYSTLIPQQFYIALFDAIVPLSQKSKLSSPPSKINQYSKVNKPVLGSLKIEEGVISLCQAQKLSNYQSNLVPPIESVNDLEVALIEITKSLVANNPNNSVTVALLSKKFCACYMQPIRVVMRSVCPDVKLIELLQMIPELHVQKVDTDWQVVLAADSVQ